MVLKFLQKSPVDFIFLNKILKRGLLFLLCAYLFMMYEIWTDLVAGKDNYVLHNLEAVFLPLLLLLAVYVLILFWQLKVSNYSKVASVLYVIVSIILLFPFLFIAISE